MASDDSSVNGRLDVEIPGKGFDFASRQNLDATTSVSKNVKGKENLVQSEDQQTLELQMLNEKYTLERKFSELRMALDEKQSEVITSAANELARRKEDLEKTAGEIEL